MQIIRLVCRLLIFINSESSAVVVIFLCTRNVIPQVTAKYEALQKDMNSLQSCADSRIGDLLSDSKLKAFEALRTRLQLEDARARLRELELTNERLQTKLETATKEYYELDSRSSQRLAELETRAEEQQRKLASYEAVESELDGVVMEAAEKCEEVSWGGGWHRAPQFQLRNCRRTWTWRE